MLGPLVLSAGLSMAGFDLRPNDNCRRFGQMMIGIAVGLHMSAPVLLELARWLPLMVVSAFFSVLMAAVVSVLLAKLARLDEKTAFFASLPGGLAEMGNIAAQLGARMEPIAIVQTLRVAMVVLTVPPALLLYNRPDFASMAPGTVIPFYWSAGLIAGGFIVAKGLALLRLNNPYMIGGVIVTAFFASSGLVVGKMQPGLFAVAQLLLGVSVGGRFRRDKLGNLWRVALYAMVSVLGLVLLMACFGVALSAVTGLPLTVGILATLPGGLAEMAVTAQLLHLAVPTIVGFQVVRGVLVNAFASYYYSFLSKSGMLSFLQRLFGLPGAD